MKWLTLSLISIVLLSGCTSQQNTGLGYQVEDKSSPSSTQTTEKVLAGGITKYIRYSTRLRKSVK